jgi:signal transduction histidine kinase/ActR/RegA family two-component response regulator
MDDFYELVHLPMVIVDIKGKVLVGVGWQPICSDFHRVNPESSRNCVESDTGLTVGIRPGEHRLYKCKNNMWDVATPLMVGEQHIGNLYSGQFFFDDEPIDREYFRQQARHYGFAEEQYLVALEAVPRLSRRTVEKAMSFMTNMAHILSRLGYSNFKMAQSATARKEAEDSLLASEHRFRSFVESAPFGIFAVAGDSFEFVNPRLLTMLDVREEDAPEFLERDPWSMFSDPQQRTDVRDDLKLHGEVRGVECEWTRGNGSKFTVRVSAGTTGPGRFHVVAEDISEHLHLEAQLRQAQKLEALGALAGGVAHDFNNLLMVINAYAEIMGAQLAENNVMKMQLEKVIHATERGASLTRQLLAFGRKQPVNFRIIDVRVAVAELSDMLRPIIGENIRCDINVADGVWDVYADGSQLQQILLNLVINARDAMPCGGALHIEARNHPADKQRTHSMGIHLTQGDFVEFLVSDSGVGIAPEIQSKIFDPFFTTKDFGKGTGLGLSTVYGLVKQMGGTVTVDSSPGNGATFRVLLPRTGVEYPNGTDLAGNPARDFRGVRVLVVEDEPAMREALATFLNQNGLVVTSACDSEQALELCAPSGCRPDIVLTDVILPGLTGPEMVEKLRVCYPGLPVVFMSGYTDDQISTAVLAERGLSFLQKPFTLGTLLSTIRDALDSAVVQ